MASHRKIQIFFLIAAMLVLGGCARGEDGGSGQFGLFNAKYPKKIGIVLSSPGKSEPGTNEAVIAGVKKAADELDAEYKVLAPKDLVNNAESLRYLAGNNYDMVIAIGKGMQDDLSRVAPEFSDIKFVIFDGEVEGPNVASVHFNVDNGAFLAGVAAASLTKSNLTGFIGGSMVMDNHLEQSFAKGIQYINMTEAKTVKMQVYYAGVTENAANDPERGKGLANNLYWMGSDVVFAGVGQLGRGAAAAAAENKKIALGADLQLMNTLPWNVYGVIVKNREKVVYEMAQKVLNGKFTAGRTGFGLNEGALDFKTSPAVLPEIAAKVGAVKEALKKGSIKPETIQIPLGMVTQAKQQLLDSKQPGAAQ